MIASIPVLLNIIWQPQIVNLMDVYLFLFLSLCLYNLFIELYAPMKLSYYRYEIKKNFL